jgi:phenylpropionate dioxygenase-like ring-hydroxylating dioxygenase large terminal subunit
MRSALAIEVFSDDTDRGGLPAWSYDNDEIVELEKELVFRRNWLVAGHVSEIPNPGDFMTFDVADERALIVRGHDGEVRAFHNVCRHRGSRVVAEVRGNCPSVIQCPFHGWSYGLDGGLRGVPRSKTFSNLSKEDLGLKPVDHEIWHGLVFVRFKGEGPSIAETMAPVEAEIAPYRIAEMTPHGEGFSVEFDVNWKAMVDVDNEGYHVPVAHPALNDLYGRSYTDEMLETGVTRSFGVFDEGRNQRLWSVRNYMNILPEAVHLPKSHRRVWIYYGFFPTTIVTLYPEMVDFYQFLPITARRSLMWGRSVALADDSREMRAARYLNARINQTTTEEDIQLIKWSWEGMRSSAFEDFILSDIESGVRAFHDRMREILPVLDEAEAPPAGTVAERNQELLDAH